MSLGQTIFKNILAGIARKARSTEGPAAKIIENFKLLRRLIFYGGSGYAVGALFQHYLVEHGSSAGYSMYPTMDDETPFTLTSKLHSHGKNMKTGDIVIFTSPIFQNQPNGKRVIGTQRDYVVLDPHQASSVGGASVPGITDWRSQEEIKKGVELKDREEPMMIEVPEGHIWVIGDNMSWSRDSRFFGAVPMALVKGKQILHLKGGMFRNWQWTVSDQMRRIPKEEEEAYLRGFRQQQAESQKVASKPTTANATGKVD